MARPIPRVPPVTTAFLPPSTLVIFRLWAMPPRLRGDDSRKQGRGTFRSPVRWFLRTLRTSFTVTVVRYTESSTSSFWKEYSGNA